jgi:hypothetical protein
MTDVDPDADPDSTDHPDADPDSDFLFDADPDADTDPTFHTDADPGFQNPDPSFKKKGSNSLISAKIGSYSVGTFWLDICKLMRIRFRIPAYKYWCGSGCRSGSGFFSDADADPGYQNDVDPCGSGYRCGSTTLLSKNQLSTI